MESPGKLTDSVIAVGSKAAGLIAEGKYDDVDKLLKPIKAELKRGVQFMVGKRGWRWRLGQGGGATL